MIVSSVLTRVRRGLGVAALAVVTWVLVTAWDPVVHAHPVYPVLLALTAVGGLLATALPPRGPRDGGAATRPRPGALRLVASVAGMLAAVGWIAAMGWLRPFGAHAAALDAMRSDDAVTVTESATQIVLMPADPGTGPALFFQPGARVDARAYVATLRPVAESGTPVVIAKQPLGIGFLALGGYGAARGTVDADGWVVGGHSLGGTSAALTAASGADVVGLLLWAAYPASDESDLTVPVLSVSASLDGLATPADITASRATLPPGTEFVVVDGASHASFGDYGAQPGDGTPTLDAAAARTAIAEASVAFLAEIG